MTTLPLALVLLGGAMTLIVVYLAVLFWVAPEKGLEFATHRKENLTEVMVNRYFVIFMVMAGALYYGRPEVVAFVFLVTGLGPAHDAWIYYRAGKPYKAHLVPATLSAIVAGWAFYLYSMTGEA